MEISSVPTGISEEAVVNFVNKQGKAWIFGACFVPGRKGELQKDNVSVEKVVDVIK